jgi:hypothetical protein
MADEKKPKIDLKARLGKTQGSTPPVVGAPTPVPPGIGGSAPRTPPPPLSSAPPLGGGIPGMSGPGIPAPPGVPVGPPAPFAAPSSPAVDPSNPLAAVASYRAPAIAAAPAAPARIEVDEVAVQEASKRATKRGMVVAMLLGLAGVGVGFVAGGAREQSAAREKSINDARGLEADLTKAKDTLNQLATKMDEGRQMLATQHKFPDQLAGQLGGLNVSFDGSELAGRRFSGFPQDTTAMLVDFITSVQALNDRKELIQGLLTKLQKPLTEQLNAPAGQASITTVALVAKDPGSGSPIALLAPLQAPIAIDTTKMNFPAEFTFTDPMGNGNAKAPRYASGDILKANGAVPVLPKTFEKVCPSETAGQAAQLAAQLGGVIRDIKGEGQASADIVTDTKAGLIERADKLLTALQKVQ